MLPICIEQNKYTEKTSVGVSVSSEMKNSLTSGSRIASVSIVLQKQKSKKKVRVPKPE